MGFVHKISKVRTRWVVSTMALFVTWFGISASAATAAAPQPPAGHRPARPPDRDEDRPGRDGVSPGVFDFGGRRGGDRWGARRDVSWERVPQARREQLFAFVKEHFPHMFLELRRLRDRNPRRFNLRMKRVVPGLLRLMKLSEERPELAALMIRERRFDMDMHILAARYRSAENDGRRKRIRRRMTELAGRAFDLRNERRTMMVREMGMRLDELKQRRAAAEAMRDELIEREVEDRLDHIPRRRGGHRPEGRDRP